MKALGVGFLTLCLVMTGLTFTGGQTVSIAREDLLADRNTLIQVEGERLTVKLTDVPLKAVLEEIGRRARIEVVFQGALTKTISIEFRQRPLEEGLRRLLRDCGWLAVGRNGRVEKVVVAQTCGGVSRSAAGAATTSQPGDSSAPDGRLEARKQPPGEAARAVTAVMERKVVKTLFDVAIHHPDQVAKLDAFRDVVNSLSAEEVGQVIGMLQDRSVPPSAWEEALAPLADVVTAEERTAVVRSLQDWGVREHVVRALEQVHLFKTMVKREGR